MSEEIKELTNEDIPIACTLTGDEQITRSAQISALFQSVQQCDELADGYSFRMPGSDEWAQRLTQFIIGERSCCPFFTFELIFEPAQGSIWLCLRGPEGTKGIIESIIGPEILRAGQSD